MRRKNLLFIAVALLLGSSACAEKSDRDEGQQLSFDMIYQNHQTFAAGEEETAEERSSFVSEEFVETQSQQDSDMIKETTETTEKDIEKGISEPLQTAEIENTNTIQEENIQEELYVGEYNSYDTDEPSLEIQKNEDGTYWIQIGIFRLVSLEDGKGTAIENGIEFLATAPNGNTLEGTITLEGDIATVTFTNAQWSAYSDVNVYKYYKTSNTPNIYAASLHPS